VPFIKPCAACGTDFRAIRRREQFCSPACSPRKKIPPQTCLQCGADYDSPHRWRQYCSRKCSGLAQRARGGGRLARQEAQRAAHPDKVCSKCRESLSLAQFTSQRTSADGRRNICNACLAEISRARHAANPASRRASAKLYFQRHPEKVRAEKSRSRKKNIQHMRAYMTKWRAKQGPDSNYYKGILEWGRRNPEKRRAAYRNYKARVTQLPGRHTANDIKQLYEAQNGKCANPKCAVSLAAGYHVDHKIAVTRPGSSNWPSNLQLLCPLCNRRKSAKLFDDWLAENSLASSKG